MVNEPEISIICAEKNTFVSFNTDSQILQSTEGNQDHVISGDQNIEISKQWPVLMELILSKIKA